jgi:hypothetical protein
MTLVELMYLHLLVIGTSLVVFMTCRTAVRALARESDERLAAQKRANIWLADQIANVANRQAGKVVAFRRPEER